jgi:hypothetical protein
MKAIVSPKKNSSIATASRAIVSNILLSPLNPYLPALKSKVSKIEMSLSESILSDMIHVDADTNVL